MSSNCCLKSLSISGKHYTVISVRMIPKTLKGQAVTIFFYDMLHIIKDKGRLIQLIELRKLILNVALKFT